MSLYAIGDVQGANDELGDLLQLIGFSPSRDQIWLCGDLVNRGPASAAVLRRIRAFGDAAKMVLGNHDFFLLRCFEGFGKTHASDTLDDVISAPDGAELCAWLRTQPLLVHADDTLMVHAGLLPQWSVAQALALAQEIETQLRGPDYARFLHDVFGNTPDTWSTDLHGLDRWRVAVNAFCRMRFCSAAGQIDFTESRGPAHAPTGLAPWFAHPHRESAKTHIVCGHWSSAGLKLAPNLSMLDSGCLWGGSLSALRLEDRRLFQVPSRSPVALLDAR